MVCVCKREAIWVHLGEGVCVHECVSNREVSVDGVGVCVNEICLCGICERVRYICIVCV